MEVIEIMFCHVLSTIALGVAVYTIFDINRFVKNYKVYEITRKDCFKRNDLSLLEFSNSDLGESANKLSNEDYIEKINRFRRSVRLPLLDKNAMKLSPKDL